MIFGNLLKTLHDHVKNVLKRVTLSYTPQEIFFIIFPNFINEIPLTFPYIDYKCTDTEYQRTLTPVDEYKDGKKFEIFGNVLYD